MELEWYWIYLKECEMVVFFELCLLFFVLEILHNSGFFVSILKWFKLTKDYHLATSIEHSSHENFQELLQAYKYTLLTTLKSKIQLAYHY